jgi:hypothetical protein
MSGVAARREKTMVRRAAMVECLAMVAGDAAGFFDFVTLRSE